MNSDYQFKRAFALKKTKKFTTKKKLMILITTLGKTTEHKVTTPFYAFRSQEQTNSDSVGRLFTLARSFNFSSYDAAF